MYVNKSVLLAAAVGFVSCAAISAYIHPVSSIMDAVGVFALGLFGMGGSLMIHFILFGK